MWELWGEGKADSPYAEVLTYQSEINNGGHDQYFFNIENTGDLKKELAVLNSVLPELLKKNLNAAYKAYVALQRMKTMKRLKRYSTNVMMCITKTKKP